VTTLVASASTKVRLCLIAAIVAVLCGISGSPRAQNIVPPCDDGGPYTYSRESLTVVPACSIPALDRRPAEIIRTTTRAGIGDEVTVAVRGLHRFLDSGTATLFLDGRRAPAIPPDARGYSSLRFILARHASDRDEWRDLLRVIRGRSVALTVSVGGVLVPLSTQVYDFELAMSPYRLSIWVLFVALLVAELFSLVRYTNLLRRGWPAEMRAEPPYSFERVLMLAWFVVILMSYVFIWTATSEVDNFSWSAAILLTCSIVIFGASRLKIVGPSWVSPTRGFINDIFAETGGVSIANAIAAGWNGLLMVLFAYSVYRYLEMPELDTPLLVILAISDAMYLLTRYHLKEQGKEDAPVVPPPSSPEEFAVVERPISVPEGIPVSVPPLEVPRELIEACVRDQCVLYAGAGLSANAGFPLWRPFVQDLPQPLAPVSRGQCRWHRGVSRPSTD
jgi:hypothetical protein